MNDEPKTPEEFATLDEGHAGACRELAQHNRRFGNDSVAKHMELAAERSERRSAHLRRLAELERTSTMAKAAAVGGGGWMVTFTGERLYVLNPDPQAIALEDIAHHLSLANRYAGATGEGYSVAQHSVHVSHVVPEQFAIHGLLHDASEAYIGDVIRPVKEWLTNYRWLESRWDQAIEERFGLRWSPEAKAAVKEADLVALATERRDLLSEWDPALNDEAVAWRVDELGVQADTRKIRVLPAYRAEIEFLRRYRELSPGGLG